jgi:hypothetical protein
MLSNSLIAARGGVESAEIRNGIYAIRDFVSAHGTSRFLAAWEPTPTNSHGDAIPGRIFDLAGYREKAGEGWDFYFTSGGWREACHVSKHTFAAFAASPVSHGRMAFTIATSPAAATNPNRCATRCT